MRGLLKNSLIINIILIQETIPIRKYQPIWCELKRSLAVTLHAPLIDHCRIIQAVRKEKANDVAWRFLLSEKNQRYKLKDESSGIILKLSLVRNDPITVDSI